MPLSAIIYTSRESFSSLSELARKRFETYPIKPYTFSFAHKVETGAVRVRATELKQGVLMPLIADLVEKGEATLASSADRDVRTITYDDLLDGANPFSRVATVQYASPTIVRVLGQDVPFPVIPEAFALYRQTWNIFSGLTLPHIVIEAMQHVRVTDFKVSSAASPFGAGVEGWVTMEMEKGRPEREIAVFNALVDFAFYCGTGAHTAEGLGQTRRMRRPRAAGCPWSPHPERSRSG